MNYLFYGIYMLYAKILKRDTLLLHPVEDTCYVLSLTANIFLYSIFNLIHKETGTEFGYIDIVVGTILYLSLTKLFLMYFKPRYMKILRQMEYKSKFQKIIIFIITWGLFAFIFYKLFISGGTYEFYKYLKDLYNGLYL